MKLSQIEKSIRKLALKADMKAQERILADALTVIGDRTRAGALGRTIWQVRMARHSLPVRLATAAAIIAVAYVGAQYLAWSLQSCSDTTALTVELAFNDIQGFFGY